MQKNLDRLGGLVHSQRVLLALTQAGISREDSYRLVQRNAMKVWGGEGDFLELLKADPEIAGKVPDDKLAACFRSEEHTSELQSLMRISYAVFCLKNTTTTKPTELIQSNS